MEDQIKKIEKYNPIISSSLDTIEACGEEIKMYDGGIFTKRNIMIEQILHTEIDKCLFELYSSENQNIQFQKTRKEFEGDITLVVFSLLRVSKKGPEQTSRRN